MRVVWSFGLEEDRIIMTLVEDGHYLISQILDRDQGKDQEDPKSVGSFGKSAQLYILLSESWRSLRRRVREKRQRSQRRRDLKVGRSKHIY